MTVINMLSLGDEGIAVADEQVSGDIRKSNIYQKLRVLNETTIYGGSGPADFIMHIYDLVYNKLKEESRNISLREICEYTSNLIISQKNSFKDRILISNLGISLDEYITGFSVKLGKPIADNIKTKAEQFASNFDEQSKTEILIGGRESDKFCIYYINTYGVCIKGSIPYVTIGSGSDESQKILSSYIAGLKRNKRESIDKVEGLAKILEATNSSARINVGVGGTLSIVYITKEGVKIPDEDRCKLTSEIVESLSLSLIDRELSYDMLRRLIFEDDKFEVVEDEFMSKVKDWKKLNKILRGYKL